MLRTQKTFVIISVFLFVFAFATSVKAWGVSISDPAIDAIRMKMIESVGVDTVVVSRFEAAQNRLSILEKRTSSLLSKTSDSCKSKSTAVKSLKEVETLLSSVHISNILTVPSNGKNKLEKSVINTSIADSIQAILSKSLAEMKSIVNTISECPQYKKQINNSSNVNPLR